MHIAILCEYASINGGENSILAMIERMAGIKVTVLAPPLGRLGERLLRKGVSHVPCRLHDENGRRLDRGVSLDRLRKIVTDLQPDLLHANSLAMGRLTGALRPELSIPTSAHLRDILRLNRTTIGELNGNDALVAVSRETARVHIEQGLDPHRTQVIHNGIDIDSFPQQPDVSHLKRALGLPESARLVATIGQISLRKGQDVFVEAAIKIAAQHPGVHWLIVGERYSEKAETVAYDEQMRRQAASAGLEGRIHWLGYREDVPQWLGGIDVLVHPARQEPFGRVLLEAGACGTAIIATRVGGTAEIIDHTQTGLLIPPDDPQAIAEAQTRLLADEPLRHSLGRAARESIGYRFAIDRQTRELTDLWRRLEVRG